MHQKVVKLIAIICSTASLYVFIGLTSDAKSYHNYRYALAKTLFVVNPEPESQLDSMVSYDEPSAPTATALSSPTPSTPTVPSIRHSSANQSSVETNRQLLSSENKTNVNRTVDDYHLNCDIHIAMTFAITVDHNKSQVSSDKSIDTKLLRSLTSISKNLNHKTHRLCVHLIVDKLSGIRAKQVIKKVLSGSQRPNGLRFYFHEINEINSMLDQLLPTLRQHFNYRPNSYYSHSLFFISLAVHNYFQTIDKLIFLDIDIQFTGNVAELYEQFGRFSPEAVIGIAYEQQPVYLHILHEYRSKVHNQTDLGDPAPKGMPGFNSGVLLMDLNRMRASKLYNSLLRADTIDRICKKYFFSGHLGDQDFYTVVSFEYRHLFHVIPCNWNRQLCQWWRYHGYRDVFDDYYKCDLKIKLFHGNCNSRLPSMQ